MTTDKSQNNRRIAKNTLLLYFRMFFILAVNLYTSRVILKVLGVEDYGIYNVVGGVVTMLSFITGPLSSASSRFIAYELGNDDAGSAERVFRCTSTIFYIYAIIGIVLAETVGLWFVQNKLSIPPGREVAAFWVYQFSIVSFVVSLLSVSYNALIIAKEHMGAFAYISIYDGLARLGVVYLLTVFSYDKLIVYAGLLLLVQLSVRLIYVIYCKRHFTETNARWLWDSGFSRKIFSYAGWSVFGHLGIVGYTQGLNILLNIYFGPVVNAARAIATQVQTALSQLYANFNTAMRPQVIKQYAQGDMDYMRSLVLKSGRFSFLLMIIICLPVLAFTEYIINLWLENPPEHVVMFVRLTVIAAINNSLSQHTLMAIQATGDIKKFVIAEGICLLSILPIAWVLLKYVHVAPEAVILVYVVVEILTQFVRIVIVYPRIGLSIKSYFTKVLIPSLLSLALCSIPAIFFNLKAYPSSFIVFALLSMIMVLMECFIIFFVGLEKDERSMIRGKIVSLPIFTRSSE